jgi:hypothetical protein
METSAAPSLPESQVPTHVEPLGNGRANPEEVRASLELVRAAQETARARARRETRRARLIVVGVIAAAGIVAWNVSSRRKHNTQEAIAATVVTPAPIVTPPPAVEPSPAAQPAMTAPVSAPVAAPVATAADVRAGAEAVAACDSAFADHQWQVVASACAAAFKARPRQSALAMRVAQAEHRRGDWPVAGEWASRAIALDANIPEAFAILARAEVRAGHPMAASAAYRRYLTLAPRGWHSAEARRALARGEGRHSAAAP